MRARIIAFSQYLVTVAFLVSAVGVGEAWFHIGWLVAGVAFVFTFVLTWSHALAVPGWPRKLAIRTAFLLVGSIIFALCYVLGYFLYDRSQSAAFLAGLVGAIIAGSITAYLDHRWNSQDEGRRLRLES